MGIKKRFGKENILCKKNNLKNVTPNKKYIGK
jgi:hypothetical protein